MFLSNSVLLTDRPSTFRLPPLLSIGCPFLPQTDTLVVLFAETPPSPPPPPLTALFSASILHISPTVVIFQKPICIPLFTIFEVFALLSFPLMWYVYGMHHYVVYFFHSPPDFAACTISPHARFRVSFVHSLAVRLLAISVFTFLLTSTDPVPHPHPLPAQFIRIQIVNKTKKMAKAGATLDKKPTIIVAVSAGILGVMFIIFGILEVRPGPLFILHASL